MLNPHFDDGIHPRIAGWDPKGPMSKEFRRCMNQQNDREPGNPWQDEEPWKNRFGYYMLLHVITCYYPLVIF